MLSMVLACGAERISSEISLNTRLVTSLCELALS